MKLWFVEIRPNVFVSGIKDATADKVVRYLFEYCPPSSGLTVFQEANVPPWYKVKKMGDTKRRLVHISGMPLIEVKNLF
jgi:CRISPR-associated protein Cas2